MSEKKSNLESQEKVVINLEAPKSEVMPPQVDEELMDDEAESSEKDEDDDDDEEEGYGDGQGFLDSKVTWLHGMIANKLIHNLKEACRITSFSDLIISSLVIGMALIAFFLVFVLLLTAASQYFGGTLTLVSYFQSSYEVLQKIDRTFGSGNAFGLIVIFVPTLFALAYFVLYLLEEYLDSNNGKIKESDVLKRVTLYWIITTVVVLPFGGINLISFWLKISGAFNMGFFGTIVKELIQLATALVSFTVVYRVLSKGLYSWNTAFISGCTAGILFEVFKQIFWEILYRQGQMPFTTMLVAAFILFSIWFFINGIIYTFGARVGYYYEFQEVFRPENEKYLESSDARSTREIALICLIELTERFYANQEIINHGKMGMSIKEICSYSMVTPTRARYVLQHLSYVELVRVLHDEQDELVVLNCSPERLSLEEFLFRIEEKLNLNDAPNLPDSRASQWFWTEYKQALVDRFRGVTLKDLYEKQKA